MLKKNLLLILLLGLSLVHATGRSPFENQSESSLIKKSRREGKVCSPSALKTVLLQINYAKATDIAALIRDKSNSLLSKEGKISVDARTNTVWIEDSAAKIRDLKPLIRRLDVPVKQVLIEARIVDVSKEFSQALGIRWGLPTSLPETEIEHPQSLLNRLHLDLSALPIQGRTPASLGFALAKIGNDIALDLELSALESEGHAKLISSPRLITTNQKPALIESGEEIPYQEATTSGATAVAFKKAALSLKVTPQITPDGKIWMDLQINQDKLSAERINGVPAIATKEIQTSVLVNNAETIVLGGIYKESKNHSVSQVPVLSKLPLLGNLFKNKQLSQHHEELLIFIRPKIVS